MSAWRGLDHEKDVQTLWRSHEALPSLLVGNRSPGRRLVTFELDRAYPYILHSTEWRWCMRAGSEGNAPCGPDSRRRKERLHVKLDRCERGRVALHMRLGLLPQRASGTPHVTCPVVRLSGEPGVSGGPVVWLFSSWEGPVLIVYLKKEPFLHSTDPNVADPNCAMSHGTLCVARQKRTQTYERSTYARHIHIFLLRPSRTVLMTSLYHPH